MANHSKEDSISNTTKLTTPFATYTTFSTKPIVAFILTFTLILFIYNNFQPYYDNLLRTTRPCVNLPISSSQTISLSLGEKSPDFSLEKKLANTTLKKNVANGRMSDKVQVLPSDLNKRVFRSFGNAASLFVQMGAYRGGPNTFSVIGLASKPIHVFGHPWYKCEYRSNDLNQSPVRTKAFKILPDWGYGRVYTVVVVNCTFTVNPNKGNAGGELVVYAYYDTSPRKFEKFVALVEPQGAYNSSDYTPPYKYDYLYCGSSLYGNLSATRIREWMAYHAWLFGEKSHFVFHDAGGVSEEVMAVLEPWIRIGRVTVQDIRDQAMFDGYYYNQFLVVNDCLHRYRHAANWTFYFDVDEYIYVPEGGGSLKEVLEEFGEFTQFTIEQNPMSSKLCLNDSGGDYSRQWGFEKLVFRDSRTGFRRDRKYAIQAKNAFATGVHMSENVVGPTLHKTESKIRYYHYHNSITVPGEPCRELLPKSAKLKKNYFEKIPFVYDNKMKKLGDAVRKYEEETLRKSVHV